MSNLNKANILENKDEHLLDEIKRQMRSDNNIFSLPERDRHDSGHAFFQYPAMMVPAVQRTLTEIVKSSQPEICSLIDPYVGAGTSLTAGMHNGLNSFGQDINPLAVLVSKVRSGPFYVDALQQHTQRVVEIAREDQSQEMAIGFPNRGKWFKEDVALELSRLKRAIESDKEIWARRFMWVTLAETIRLTSNDRTTTYKLHARPRQEIETRTISPLAVFSQLVIRNLQDLTNYKNILLEKGYVNNGRFTGRVTVAIGDTTAGLDKLCQQGQKYFDLLVTSPPYGDNKTTITYGQHAYLPLQWIDLQDIDPSLDKSCLATTMAIDTNSMGGKRSLELADQIDRIRQSSSVLCSTLIALQSKPRDRMSRVAAFYDDFILSLDKIIAVLKKNAYMIFTVGNRSVGGIEIPNDKILCDLLERRDAKLITQFDRRIHNKRMPDRNQIARMMRTEKILIFRKSTEPEEQR